jgi:hypothetical protein
VFLLSVSLLKNTAPHILIFGIFLIGLFSVHEELMY